MVAPFFSNFVTSFLKKRLTKAVMNSKTLNDLVDKGINNMKNSISPETRIMV